MKLKTECEIMARGGGFGLGNAGIETQPIRSEESKSLGHKLQYFFQGSSLRLFTPLLSYKYYEYLEQTKDPKSRKFKFLANAKIQFTF